MKKLKSLSLALTICVLASAYSVPSYADDLGTLNSGDVIELPSDFELGPEAAAPISCYQVLPDHPTCYGAVYFSEPRGGLRPFPIRLSRNLVVDDLAFYGQPYFRDVKKITKAATYSIGMKRIDVTGIVLPAALDIEYMCSDKASASQTTLEEVARACKFSVHRDTHLQTAHRP